MNFLLLGIQSVVCVACVMAVKRSKVVQVRDFDIQDAKTWYPISLLLVTVIYTGSKSLVSILPDTHVKIMRIHWVAIPEYTRLYHLQEPYHHINRE
jgi:GDP-mannose transporter